MSLDDILWKDPIISTVSVGDLKKNPDQCEERYGKHHATHVSIPELAERWERVFKRISSGQSVLGAVYGPYGFGKTGAAIELWALGEKRGIVCTPPFMCTEVNDILEAAHTWARHRLSTRHPELLSELDAAYQQACLRTNDELVVKISRQHGVSQEQARSIIAGLAQQGELRLDVRPSNVISYLKKATDILVSAEFKGFIIIPDEFKLFAGSSADTDANISRLTELVWALREEKRPLGLIFFMPEDKFSEIRLRSGDVTQRLGAHQVVLNLFQVYDSDFPQMLWEAMAKEFGLSREEKNCIDPDVLLALGQFCERVEFLDGPRSVVATFNRAVLKYKDTGKPYNVFDFVDDYISGQVVFDGKEMPANKALSRLFDLVRGEGAEARKAARLLAAFPDGCPDDVADRYQVRDVLSRIAGKFLGDYVINSVLGPTLRVYKTGEETDKIAEALRGFKKIFNPTDMAIKRMVLRSFWNFVVPKLFPESRGGGVVGWTGHTAWEDPDSITYFKEATFVGAPSKEYPKRKLVLRVTIEESYWDCKVGENTHLGIAILLDSRREAVPRVDFIDGKKCRLRLPIGRCIDTKQIPGDIARLRDIFLPSDVTPQLLLAVADFFELSFFKSSSIGKQERDKAEVMVKQGIVQRAINELFSEELRESSGFNNIAIGEKFLESLLVEIFRQRYPGYTTLLSSSSKHMQQYLQALQSSMEPVLTVAQKRGLKEIEGTKSQIAKKFGHASHATFREVVRSHWNNLMELRRWEGQREESSAFICLKLHPLETTILSLLRESRYSTEVLGARVRAVTLASIYDSTSELGYLPEEVDYAIQLLEARGYCGLKELKGQKVLHESVSRNTAVELQQEYRTFKEKLNQLRKITGTTPDELFKGVKWDLTEDIETLVAREEAGETVEVELDQMQHDLRFLANTLHGRISTLVVETAAKLNEISAKCKLAAPRSIPAHLDAQKTPIPPTDFATLLHNIQVELKKRYAALSEEYDRLQTEVAKSIAKYDNEKTKVDLIALLEELLVAANKKQGELTDLEKKRKVLEEQSSNFQKWLRLNGEIYDFRFHLLQQGDSSQIASSLLENLDREVVFRIKEHIANKKLEALNDNEVFYTNFQEIYRQWKEAAEDRRKQFNVVAETYKQLLQQVGLKKVDIYPGYDEENPATSQKQLLDNVSNQVEYMKRTIKQHLEEAKNEILKAKKVYDASDVAEIGSLEHEWSKIKTTIEDLFGELNDAVIANVTEFQEWIEKIVPFTQPEGSILRLKESVDRLRSSVRHTSLEPEEDRIFQLLTKYGGNIAETFVHLHNEDPRYERVEDILAAVVSLYKKGRVNLNATPIQRE